VFHPQALCRIGHAQPPRPHGSHQRSSRLPARRVGSNDRSLEPSSHALGVTFRGDAFGSARAPPPKQHNPNTPSHGVWVLYDARGRKQRPTPGFHARLSSVFRFSQPLDALLRSQPFQPCFMLVAPLSFSLQGVPLRGSEDRVPTALALHAVTSPVSEDPVRPDFEDLRTRGVRCSSPVLPGLRSSSPS